MQHFAGRGELCYRLTKERLSKEYGSSWVVHDVCEHRLKDFPTVKSNDAKEMKRFSELLEKTLVTVNTVKNFGSLNTSDTLTTLVSKLICELKRR